MSIMTPEDLWRWTKTEFASASVSGIQADTNHDTVRHVRKRVARAKRKAARAARRRNRR